MSHHPIANHKCPHCGIEGINCVTNATEGDDAEPQPGDLSICAYCEGLVTFDKDMHVVKASWEDIQWFRDHKNLVNKPLKLS